MEGYLPLKLKRKDLEDVNDDFSDFSLSSPARKIRRLDAELPPIIEEEECEIPMAFEHSPPLEQGFGSNSAGGLKIEELPSEPSNDERAIVLFQPSNPNPLLHSPSSFTVSVNPHLISMFKNRALQSSQAGSWKLVGDEGVENTDSGSSDSCLAVVPWVRSQFSPTHEADLPCQVDNCDMMDAQDMEEAKMDVEEDGSSMDQSNANEADGMIVNEGFHQWQQHCLIPQPLPHNATAPIVWYQ